jgi:membrane-associated phospholipid phosphatase
LRVGDDAIGLAFPFGQHARSPVVHTLAMTRPSFFVVVGLMAGAITLPGVARAAEPPAAPGATAPAPTAPAAPAAAAPSAATPDKAPDAPSAATPDKAPVAPSAETPAKAPAAPPDFQSSTSPKRTKTLEPQPVYAPSTLGGARMQADPISDGAVLGIALGFGALSDLIISTGELGAVQISPTFSISHLLGIDRGAVTQQVQSSAVMLSNIGLYAAFSFAAIDSVATGFREDSRQAALVDVIIYGESLALTAAVTNLAKMAVRRPRPIAYMEALAHKNDPTYRNVDTDSSLSFFSGHSATVATVAGTATYLAFTRSPHSIRPWLTLAGGTALTTFVAYERVRAGAHFPTDVIAGAFAGAGIGVLVAHLHREDTAKQRRVWIGFTPGLGEGGTLTLSGLL